MKKILIIVLFASITLVFGCKSSSKQKDDVPISVPVVNSFDQISHWFSKDNDTTYVINFWATWCAPCVKELPYFDRIGNEFSNQKIKILLINLDFSNHYDTRLLPFMEQHQIKSKVIMLDDPDANRWINLVDPSWSGAIPATVIYNKHRREFHEKEFDYEELYKTVSKFFNYN